MRCQDRHYIMVTTKPSLPRLGLGLAALGRPGYITLDHSKVLGPDRSVDDMQRQADAVMDRLFELCRKEDKMPWLDCARSYGLAEKFAGDYLRRNKIAPDNVYVSSKWGYTYVADWNITLAPGEKHEIKNHSVEILVKQLKETSQCIGEYVDLYQIHSATFESGVLSDSQVHNALADCRKENGWAIGLSVSSTEQSDILRIARAIQVNGRPLFDSVQCTYNVLEQQPEQALREAAAAGMDIIVKEGLANGRALQSTKLQSYATQLSCEANQLALACILSQEEFAPCVLSGAVTPDQLTSNWRAYQVRDRLLKDRALLSKIMQMTAVESQAYWSERNELVWN